MGRTLIIGLGNPIMGDDAVGCKCAEKIKTEIPRQEEVEVEIFFRGGISLMERIIGFERVLIIDSITGSGKPVGAITRLTLSDLPSRTATSPHDGSLKTAYDFGLQMGVQLPKQVDIIAVEIEPGYEFSEQLSAPVEASIPQVARMAKDWLKGQSGGSGKGKKK